MRLRNKAALYSSMTLLVITSVGLLMGQSVLISLSLGAALGALQAGTIYGVARIYGVSRLGMTNGEVVTMTSSYRHYAVTYTAALLIGGFVIGLIQGLDWQAELILEAILLVSGMFIASAHYARSRLL
jgi:hypothetical protein